jgi:glutamyl/glutaminyl-tRNA synthetase
LAITISTFQIETPHVVSYQEGVVNTEHASRITPPYRGRIAPSPTGLLHLGHARTFWTAQQRARERGGTLILRNEDLDHARCKPEFVRAMFDDLRWFGFEWSEGPDCGGPFAPYSQSERMPLYRATLQKLIDGGFVYPCTCSRKDIQAAVTAPHAADDEAIYPGTCRSKQSYKLQVEGCKLTEPATFNLQPATKFSLRFRVPDGKTIAFTDGNLGPQQFIAGKDFGDFVVWRHDDVPAYQLACVADDAAMQITEVVRGADLLVSTARQLLLHRALNLQPPAFFHCPLLADDHGVRLAKRHDALSLRHLCEQGRRPEEVRAAFGTGIDIPPVRS